MREIERNIDNIKNEEITDFITKVKVLLLDKKGRILSAYSNNQYQFVGGSKEENETLNETLIREVSEETGIKLKEENYKPFLLLKSYYKDSPSVGKNKLVEIYYYKIIVAEKPNIKNMKLTSNEKRKNFKIKEIKFKNLEKTLIKNANKSGDKKGIISEMLDVLKNIEV